MRLTYATVLLSLALPTALATEHTPCYNYFLQKDGCVVNTPGDARCVAPHHQATQVKVIGGVKGQGHKGPPKQKRDVTHSLVRRYDTYNPVKLQSSVQVDKVCDQFTSHKKWDDKQPGACLAQGWVNNVKASNCGKQLWIAKDSHSVFVPVLGACEDLGHVLDTACFQIGLTEKTFSALKPTPAEQESKTFKFVKWDFNNYNQSKTQQGPV